MVASKISSDLPETPQVVGTIHSPGSLRRALRLKPGEVDFLEIRLDHLADDLRPLIRALPRLKFPLIVTARHPAEGGKHALPAARRAQLLVEFLPFATFIDVELRSVGPLASVVKIARSHEVRLIVSAHHFHSTPPITRLLESQRRQAKAGADVVKIATRASKPGDLAALLTLLAKRGKIPLSVMGMGQLGKASRLALAAGGSILNYGYLDEPNASGQWEATLLKKRIAELRAM